ncbi:MAG TPA: class I SAM-dependent methyltransferase [Paracoccaceae bacterium]|nr:class I SAM-dependent methyltransferase [Paracoccaceae bacterium]HMO70741.1 class I SAM-dependent methyltransferase [Paracoccaceae bacterium]
MAAVLSPRLAAILAALPLAPGLRVLEIGCGPGALARAIAAAIGDGQVLGIDRSPRAIAQARAAGGPPTLSFRLCAIEDLVGAPGEGPFDLAVAIRVGVLDGRHPRGEARALDRVAAALRQGGRLFIDTGAETGAPLREIALPPRF